VDKNAGRIAIDTLPSPAKVTELLSSANADVTGAFIFGAHYSASETKPICTTPCVVNLPFGSHVLSFIATSPSFPEDVIYNGGMTVMVGDRPSVARLVLGRSEYHRHQLDARQHAESAAESARQRAENRRAVWLFAAVGPAVIGGGLLSAGLISNDSDSGKQFATGLTVAGVIGLVLSGAFVVIGLSQPIPDAPTEPALQLPAVQPSVFQESNGIQWEPADGVIFRR